jgi:hypothetical protein
MPRDHRVDLRSRGLLSALRPHRRSTYIGVPALSRRASARTQHNTNRHASRSQGAVMEFVEHADDRPEPISIERCRELLGEEAESMTDQEIASIRRHAEKMACVLIEMYQEGCRIPQ